MPKPPNMLFNAHKKSINTLQHTIAQQASLLDVIERAMAVIEFNLDGTVITANVNFLPRMGYIPDADQGSASPHVLHRRDSQKLGLQ
ncbi:hypothetical protein [Pseudomonas sp. EL_65y_Pfl1_R32]|uniref:hypothetical protein n=1 Tax=unclassified Pseudomonas TaxID=196821 RepID=UPI00351A96EF